MHDAVKGEENSSATSKQANNYNLVFLTPLLLDRVYKKIGNEKQKFQTNFQKQKKKIAIY